MMTLSVLVAVLSACNGATVWDNNFDFKSAGLAVPEQGNYRIWAWGAGDDGATVKINGKDYTAQKPVAKGIKGWAWYNVGDLELPKGKASIEATEKVAAILASTNHDLDPQKVVADTRVYDTPRGVDDARVTKVRNTDTIFTMPPYDTKEEWEAKAADIRQRMLLACGLWPMPERTPLKAEVSGKIQHDDYSVEKVHFEAWPGFLVTGNLYRPVGNGPFPAVLSPHGHWKKGRLENTDTCSVPGRCITLARMGMVAFSVDMLGYNDSRQLMHQFQGVKEKLWGIHPFALQLWGNIRALDFLESLPYVDKDKLGCTGASGGGTQTFALTAVDPRVKVSAPVNMISCSMQGGCPCENAPLIRMTNSNMEIGAMMAPKPMLMVSATGDWTRETPHVEYPAVKSIYKLYNAEDHVTTVLVKSGHNYNQESREAVYRFFGKWLLGKDNLNDYKEPPFTLEKEDDLKVFTGTECPPGYPKQEELLKQLTAAVAERTRARMATLVNADEKTLEENRHALASVFGAVIPGANDLDCERTGMEEHPDYVLEHWVLHRKGVGDAVPALFYRAVKAEPQDAVVIVDDREKERLNGGEAGRPDVLVDAFLKQGKAVLKIDVFLQGEHNSCIKKAERTPSGMFMDTFMPTDTAYRVQDVLTAAAFLRARRDLDGRVHLVGIGRDGGMWCLFAGAIDASIASNRVDLSDYKLDDDTMWAEHFYVPGLRAIGDAGLAALLQSHKRFKMWNANGLHGAPYDGLRGTGFNGDLTSANDI